MIRQADPKRSTLSVGYKSVAPINAEFSNSIADVRGTEAIKGLVEASLAYQGIETPVSANVVELV